MIYSFRDENYFSISQCYDRTFIPNHLMPEIHKHGGFEIMYIVNGNVSVEFFDGESNALDEVYHLFPGDFIFLDSARFHRLRVSETGARIVNIEVSPTREPRHPGQRSLGRMVAYDEKLRDFFRQNPGAFRLYDDSDLFNTLFLLVRRYFAEARDEAALVSLLYVLLSDVAALYLKNLRSYRGHAYIKKAIFLIENCLGNITPDELARAVGVSRGYLHKLFKTCFERSIAEYITEYRIKRACNRFRSFSDMRVSDVAAELGYGSLLRFERAFKRVTGMTPGEYKQKSKQSTNTWIVRREKENDYINLPPPVYGNLG